MATLDVEGRCLRLPLGKGKNPAAAGAQVQIQFANCGVVPKLDVSLTKLQDQHSSKGIRKFPTRGATSESDDLKKPSTRKHPTAERQSAQAAIVAAPRGKKKVGGFSAEGASSPAFAEAPAASPDAGAAKKFKISAKSPRVRLMTAEQNALRRLERVLATAEPDTNPNVAAISKAVAVGGDVAIELDKRLRKQTTVLEAQREIQRSQASSGAPQRPKSADLGRTTLTRAPFATAAVDGSPAYRASRRVYSQKFAMGVEDANPVKENRRPKSANGGVPFDTSLNSAMYPEPPGVGASVSRAATHAGKHRVEQALSDGNLDEALFKKAVARCPQSAAQIMPDFLFGQPPIASERRVRLSERQEAQFKSREAYQMDRPTGKVFSAQKNARSALW